MIRLRLTPAIADVRRAVRESLGSHPKIGPMVPTGPGRHPVDPDAPLVFVALSGGADSLSLAAATAFEAKRAGVRAGAIIVDHGLQEGSADVAESAAGQARSLGLDPVVVKTVTVPPSPFGPEAAARKARLAAFADTVADTGAVAVLIAHTLDDQAETVLLGLARGSGASSLRGMAGAAGLYLRPLLKIPRRTTRQFCIDSELVPWEDPHNTDPHFARVRVRQSVLPVLEAQLGPGIAEALARSADQLREDSRYLDRAAATELATLADEGHYVADPEPSVRVEALQSLPAAIVHRVVRQISERNFDSTLSRSQTLEAVKLIGQWRGQKWIDLPGFRVVRRAGWLYFESEKPGTTQQ